MGSVMKIRQRVEGSRWEARDRPVLARSHLVKSFDIVVYKSRALDCAYKSETSY